MQKKFSYPVKVDELNQNEYRYIIDAAPEELEDIRQILKVEKVEKFSAEIFLKLNIKQHLLRVWGNVRAVLALQSVISLNIFSKKYDIPFELLYDTKATYRDMKEKELGIYDNEPDIIENGTIDLADLALEQIALNMEDYPRDEGEVFDYAKYNDQPEEKQSPFSVLQKLKK